MTERTYQLPIELKTYHACGVKVDFEVFTGVVLKKNFLSSAQDLTDSERESVIYQDGEKPDIQEQVWIRVEEAGGSKSYGILFSGADVYFDVDDKISVVVGYTEDEPAKYLVLYNHSSDEEFYLEDADDTEKRINVMSVSPLLDVFWKFSAFSTIFLLMVVINSGMMHDFGTYIFNFVVVTLLCGLISYLDVKHLLRGTWSQFILTLSLIFGGFMGGYNEGYGHFILQLSIYGGLLALLPAYMFYFDVTKRGKERFIMGLIRHLEAVSGWLSTSSNTAQNIKKIRSGVVAVHMPKMA